MRVFFGALIILSTIPGFLLPVAAQSTPPGRLWKAATLAPDLTFPSAPSPIPDHVPQLAIHKPEGAGRFPALILHHQCGGLSLRPNKSMLTWAREAVKRGYVVLMIDSLGPRDVKIVCMGPQNGVNFFRGMRDALQAAEYLSNLDYVDPKRIGHLGFSWGAMVAALVGSKSFSAGVSSSRHLRAAVAFYPGCFQIKPPNAPPFEILQPDIDLPLLILMGDKDTETPPSDCLARLEPLKSQAAPVEWFIYPSATHCWDCAHLHGLSKVDIRGNQVLYQYDKNITDDSARRTFEFFERAMPPR